MGEDDDDVLEQARRLPFLERATHKNWKVRDAAFQEVAGKFERASEDDKIFNECSGGLFPKAIKDSNAAAQLSVLGAVVKFAEFGPDEIVRGIAAFCSKSIATNAFAGRPINRKRANDVLLAFVYADCGEITIDALANTGYIHKNPKVIAASVDATKESLDLFGAKELPIQIIVKSLPGLLEHGNANVRSSAKALTAELFHWLGSNLQSGLKGIKDATLKEIEVLKVESAERGPARAARVTKRIERLHAESPVGGSKVDEEGQDGEEGVVTDSSTMELDLREEVNLVGRMETMKVEVEDGVEKDWWTAIQSSKWSVRKSALGAVSSELDERRLASAEGLEGLLTKLRQVIAKDGNVVVVASASLTVAALAKSLGTKFPAAAGKGLTGLLLTKLKERNRTLADGIHTALSALHAERCIVLKDVVEELNTVMEGKVPKAKVETLTWLKHCLDVRASSAVDAVKEIGTMLTKRCEDSSGDVREIALQCLAVCVVRYGDRAVKPFLNKLDKIRTDKIVEYVAEKRKTEEASKTTTTKTKMEEKPLMTAPAPTMTTTTNLKKMSPVRRTLPVEEAELPDAVAVVDTLSGCDDDPSERNPAVVALPILSEDDITTGASSMFSNVCVADLGAKSAAARKAVVEEMAEVIGKHESLSLREIAVVLELLRAHIGLRDGTFSVLNAKFELVGVAMSRTDYKTIGGECVGLAVEEILDKLGDFKSGKVAENVMKKVVVYTGPKLVFDACVEMSKSTRNPKTICGLCEFISVLIVDFYDRTLLEDVDAVLGVVKIATSNGASAVRNAGASLAAAYDLRTGKNRMSAELKHDEKATASYEIAKAKQEGSIGMVSSVTEGKSEYRGTHDEKTSKGSLVAEVVTTTPHKVPTLAACTPTARSVKKALPQAPTAGTETDRPQRTPATTSRKTPAVSPTEKKQLIKSQSTPATDQRRNGEETFETYHAPSPVPAAQSHSTLSEAENENENPPHETNPLDALIRSVRSGGADTSREFGLFQLTSMVKANTVPPGDLQAIVDLATEKFTDAISDVRHAAFDLLATCIVVHGFESEKAMSALFQALVKKQTNQAATSCLSKMTVTVQGVELVHRHAKRVIMEEKAVVRRETLAWILGWTKTASSEDIQCARLLLPVLTDMTTDKTAGIRLQASRLVDALTAHELSARSKRKPKSSVTITGKKVAALPSGERSMPSARRTEVNRSSTRANPTEKTSSIRSKSTTTSTSNMKTAAAKRTLPTAQPSLPPTKRRNRKVNELIVALSSKQSEVYSQAAEQVSRDSSLLAAALIPSDAALILGHLIDHCEGPIGYAVTCCRAILKLCDADIASESGPRKFLDRLGIEEVSNIVVKAVERIESVEKNGVSTTCIVSALELIVLKVLNYADRTTVLTALLRWIAKSSAWNDGFAGQSIESCLAWCLQKCTDEYDAGAVLKELTSIPLRDADSLQTRAVAGVLRYMFVTYGEGLPLDDVADPTFVEIVNQVQMTTGVRVSWKP